MSVIVRMEMPDWCPCELAIDNNGWFSPCFAYDGIPSRDKEFDDCVENRKRPSWCPIVGVLPEQHGDLIDRQATIKEFEPYAEYESNRSNAEWVQRIKTVLNSITAIIAEERSET